MEITKGKKFTPPKVVIYGPEGIGKSTLASKFPQPLFVDVEGGTNRLDVHRVDVKGVYANVQAAIRELTADGQGYKTLVIDTADWLDRLICDAVCARGNFEALADFGYGKGYQLATQEWSRLLDLLGVMQAHNGMGVVCCAHAAQRKIENIGDANSYDHWEMKLLKQSSPVLKEWADFLLFLRYDVSTLTTKDGKTRPTGGQRVICTAHTLQYDAKSREELPAKMPLNDDSLAKIFDAIYISPSAAPAPAPAPAPEPAPEPAPAPAPEPEPEPKAEPPAWTRKLLDCMAAQGITREEMDAVVVAKGMYPTGTPVENYNEAACNRLAGNFERLSQWIKAKRSAK